MYTDPILELELAKDHIRELAKEHRSVSHWQTPRARARASGQRLSMRAVLVAVFRGAPPPVGAGGPPPPLRYLHNPLDNPQKL
jgi:hypothetical protein